MNLRRWIPIGLFAAVATLVLVTLYIQRKNGENVGEILFYLDWQLIALALVLHLWMHILWGTRIRMLADGIGIRLTPAAAWRVATSGQFGGAVTPGRMGAEATRIALLMRGGASGADASRVVLLDRSSDIIFYTFGGLLVTIMLPVLFPGAHGIQAFGFFAVAGLAFFITIIVWGLRRPITIANAANGAIQPIAKLVGKTWHVTGHVHAFLYRIRDGIVAIAPSKFALSALLSLLLWCSEFGVLWVLFRAFGYAVPFASVLAAGIMITMLSALPISAGGAGVAEVAGLILFAILAPGIPSTFVLLWRGLTYYYDVLVGGLVAAYSFLRPNLARGQPEPDPL